MWSILFARLKFSKLFSDCFERIKFSNCFIFKRSHFKILYCMLKIFHFQKIKFSSESHLPRIAVSKVLFFKGSSFPAITVSTNHILKGQSNEIFDLLFFSSFQPAWATDQWVKIFSYLVSFSPRYSNFNCEKTDSPGYDTPRSQKKKFNLSFAKNRMQPFNG